MTPDDFIKELNAKIKAATGQAADPEVKIVHDFGDLKCDNLTVDMHPLKQQIQITFTHRF